MPRSGTTLLYDMLLSAGGFAVYLAESNVFNVLALRFGDLAERSNREKLLGVWLGSKLFRATGLSRQLIEQKVLDECHDAGDFLRIVMSEIARSQGMQRWAENSPECLLHLPLIKQLIPDALVIHIIRDGRDVATSLEKVRYVHPFPWEERQNLIGSGVYWEWIVQRGRAHGKQLGKDYLEVRFEDLIASPQETLNRVGHSLITNSTTTGFGKSLMAQSPSPTLPSRPNRWGQASTRSGGGGKPSLRNNWYDSRE